MSLTARSALGGLPKAQDENPQFAAKQAKSTTTNGARRGAAALSDITNVAGLANAGGLTQKVRFGPCGPFICHQLVSPSLSTSKNGYS